MSDQQGANRSRDRLVIEEEHPGCNYVSFLPSETRYAVARQFLPELPPIPVPAPLLLFDATHHFVSITPIKTSPSLSYLGAKYGRIKEISLELYPFDVPETEEDVVSAILGFPEGFMREFEWGLGVHKQFKPIIEGIAKIPGITSLLISREQPTGLIGNGIFCLFIDDWEDLRLDMNRIQNHYQKEGLIDRRLLVNNELLHKVMPASFALQDRPYPADGISKLKRTSQGARITKNDRAALLDATEKRLPELAAKEPDALFRLHNTIELVALETLIEKFATLLAASAPERRWQELFNLNPFILTLVFGYPTVLVNPQAYVGGQRLTGRGGKFADYALRNCLTSNMALAEIKTPKIQLVLDGTYRDQVHKIGPEITNTVVQILDQRQKLLTHFLSVTHDAPVRLEAYSVDCVVIAGTMPTEKDKQKTFEIYRSGFKDVRIVTFDELHQRLVALKDYLAEHVQRQPQSGLIDPENDLPF
jgi:hypothetical protein